tara:strand:+ start:535 stop:789 length:255 start_codon:yes stop_codon:yes gene_type:complete
MGFKMKGPSMYMNCGCGQMPCKTYGYKMSSPLDAHCTSKPAKYSSPAKKKDACYRKAKAKYDVFPSAYASGYIAKCRKRGGNIG